MTPEISAKARETQAKKQALYDSQCFVIGDWQIRRLDELNWELTYKGKFQGYYSSLLSAFRRLPDKMLNLEAKSSLNQLIDQQKAILDRIQDALRDVKLADKLLTKKNNESNSNGS